MNDQLHGYDWLCEKCNISPNTARQWVHKKRVPHIKLAGGKLVRFRESDIDAWLAQQVRQPEEPKNVR